ncbi:hypothetical protein EJ04DRAFT_455244 [Polyplosphaeria fusca]|uniref:ribonuclease Z n=1 Tax=Polyplosphaeria fusca TaxID=682080 RepID=A0A9P4RCL3_9PLEO|nr:hypothetical protein EJ04DRAFT_455244 [Polyplosphaeria fusca]
MDSSIQFVTTPTADTPGTALVFQTSHQSYLFGNESEGTQRAMSQMGMRLIKTQDFFLTGRCEWGNTGGMLGMILTLADVTSTAYEDALDNWRKKSAKRHAPMPARPSLNIHGPPNLKHMFATCRRYVFRKGMPVKVTEYKEPAAMKMDEDVLPPTWTDSNIKVWALSVAPAGVQSSPEAEAAFASKQDTYDNKFNNFEDMRGQEGESKEQREARHDGIRAQVLEHMFDSDWKFDTLIEKHISEVQLPAAVYVRNPANHHLETYAGPLPGGTEPLPDIKVLTRTPWPGALIQALPPTRPALEAVSYMIQTFPMRGKFDVKRAEALGVKPGPKYAELTNGRSVQGANGATITPDMVLGPDKPAQTVAIFDIPSLAYVEPLLQREELSHSSVIQGLSLCVWILGRGVLGHPSIAEFMQNMNNIEHVISSVDNCVNRLALDSAAEQTVRLGKVDPARYKLPHYDTNTLPQQNYAHTNTGTTSLVKATVADRGLKFRIMPKFEKITKTIPPLLDISTVEESLSPDIIELAKAAQQDAQNDAEGLLAWKQLLARPDTEIITLGTGSAMPSKYRNVSATLVRVPSVGNYLLDCGENTLGQLQRVFTPLELRDVLKDLRMIWISHLHADHQLGTTSVIKAWYELVHKSVPTDSRPSMDSLATSISTYGLTVVSHEGMLRWLCEYSEVEDFGYSRIIPLEIRPARAVSETGSELYICPKTKQTYGIALRREDFETVFGLADIQACYVSHCRGAMAVSLTFPNEALTESQTPPLKISYSGDCRPSNNFTRIGRNSTVLIHEATFDDELKSDAIAKKHSTTSEALGIGAKMNAKAVVLTHFSQRYQKIPVLQTVDGEDDVLVGPNGAEDFAEDPAAEDFDPTTEVMNTDGAGAHTAEPTKVAPLIQTTNEQIIKVGSKDMKVAIAFDYMRVKIGEIAELEKFNHALGKLLMQEDDAATQEVNNNGKKSSDGEGGGKKKKSKRNN